MAEAPPAEGEVVVKKPPPLVKRRDSELERDRQGSFSRVSSSLLNLHRARARMCTTLIDVTSGFLFLSDGSRFVRAGRVRSKKPSSG